MVPLIPDIIIKAVIYKKKYTRIQIPMKFLKVITEMVLIIHTKKLEKIKPVTLNRQLHIEIQKKEITLVQ